MSIYRVLTELGSKFVNKHILFKHGFNLSPMYRRTTAKVTHVSKDLDFIKVKLPISYKNRNYMNTIFGGSMFAAVDPIPMTQFINILGNDYVVWDKSVEIKFKRPATEDLYAEFVISKEEIESIKKRLANENEIDVVKLTQLTDKNRERVFCEVYKTIYIASKTYYKQKRKQKQNDHKNLSS